MTPEEILENNRLIAEAMGGKYKKDMPLTAASYMEEDKHIWVPIHGIVRFDTIEIGKGSILKYHSSWDWLMPAVEKIERLDYADTVITIQEDDCNVSGGDFQLHVSEYSKFHSVYKAVVEFFKWYNQNQES